LSDLLEDEEDGMAVEECPSAEIESNSLKREGR
jgi:hypothetical protein